MSRSKAVLGAALLLGFLAALAGYAGLQAMARQVRAGASKEFVPVVVSMTDLTFGTKLDKARQLNIEVWDEARLVKELSRTRT